jgi:hypothetical protein
MSVTGPSIHSRHPAIPHFNYPITRLLNYQILAAVAVVAAASCGCKAAVGELTAEARNEWKRTYSLGDRGEVRIFNSNGKIDIEGIEEGASVEIRAERIARGATEAVARDLLPRINIKEDATPARISIETDRIPGLMIGASFVVDYYLRVPASAIVRARTGNGSIAAKALAGRAVLTTVNGAVGAEDLRGGVEVRTVNGRVDMTLGAVGEDPIDVRTTNGAIDLTLPENAKVTLSASALNGTIDVNDAPLALIGEADDTDVVRRGGRSGIGERLRRRVRGRLNGGGTPMDLTAVNGKIRVSVRSQGNGK